MTDTKIHVKGFGAFTVQAGSATKLIDHLQTHSDIWIDSETGENNMPTGQLKSHMTEANDMHSPGAKADTGKPPVQQGVLDYFPLALLELAKVSHIGASKYSWEGWRSVPNGITRYGNAMVRHLLQKQIEGEYDFETGCLHDAQVAWNALAVLELKLKEQQQLRQSKESIHTFTGID